jgi:HNH endonuclease
MASDYLFTWTPKGWPYAKLRALVDSYERGQKVTEPWRCQAHKAAKPGDTAYLIKLGDGLQGIFGIGTITGPAQRNPLALPKENPWQVPITFDRLVDPTKAVLVSAEQLASIPVPTNTWHPRASGTSLSEIAARQIDEFIVEARDQALSGNAADTDNFDSKNASDARDRINRSIAIRRGQQTFRSKLIGAYEGKCAITGCDVIDLLEAAHIQPYRGSHTNHVQNGLLLRTDIHTLFDCRLIAIEPATMTVVLAPRLLRSSYKILANRRIRLPKAADQQPSVEALFKHRRLAGL